MTFFQRLSCSHIYEPSGIKLKGSDDENTRTRFRETCKICGSFSISSFRGAWTALDLRKSDGSGYFQRLGFIKRKSCSHSFVEIRNESYIGSEYYGEEAVMKRKLEICKTCGERKVTESPGLYLGDKGEKSLLVKFLEEIAMNPNNDLGKRLLSKQMEGLTGDTEPDLDTQFEEGHFFRSVGADTLEEFINMVDSYPSNI